MTISGMNLSGATINPIPGITITPGTATATSVTATFAIAANAATGPQNVTVATSGGTSSAVTFTINPPGPSLSVISPSSGVVGATSTPVTLTGMNLSGATINPIPGITITPGTAAATSVTATFAIAANAATGPQKVTVMTAGGMSNSVTFTINPAVTFKAIRINTGGGSYTDTLGTVWAADSNYSGGSLNSTTKTIGGTSDQQLYQNWRYAPSSGAPLVYTFTGIPSGSYTVSLDFADPSAPGVGQRVFNVSINGTTMLSNFDIIQAAGQSTAVSRSFPVNVTAGQITITFTNVTSNWPAIINAIAIQ